jgi:hypothetical protein
MQKNINILLIVFVAVNLLTGCKKDIMQDPAPSGASAADTTAQSSQTAMITTNFLSYGDTIFYLHPGINNVNNIIAPKNFTKAGKFYGFPKGIELDSITGKINLTESESGLRYKILFVPKGTKDTIRTKIVISGINFYDRIYNLSKGDSIAPSIYNASGVPFFPGQFGSGKSNVFDDGNGCNSQGCAVSLINGKINLAKSLRNGAIPRLNDSQKEFSYYYRMDDRSDKALNKLKVKLYYYNTAADIPKYLWDILLIDHAGTIIPSTRNAGIKIPAASQATTEIATAKPRPPCIIIIMR